MTARPPEPVLRVVGAIIASHRHRLGWSQLDLAYEAEVGSDQVSKIERGLVRGVNLVTIVKLCRSLHLSVLHLSETP